MTPDIVTHEAERASNRVAADLRRLLRALGPKDTKKRKVLQKKLRLATKAKPIDLPAFARARHAALRQIRLDAPTRRTLAVHASRMHRIRVRAPKLGDCDVQDTRKDSAGKRLYFELSNGQAVEASRILGTRGYDASAPTALRNNSKWRRVVAPAGNPVIVSLVRKELATNSARTAA